MAEEDLFFISSKEDFILPEFINLTGENNFETISDYINVNTVSIDPELINPKSKLFESIYTTNKKIFKKLTRESLLKFLETFVYVNFPMLFDDLEINVMRFKKEIDILRSNLTEKYSKVSVRILKDSEKRKFIDLDSSGNYDYSLLSSIIFIVLDSSKKINANTVIKEIKLSKKIPVASSVDPITFKHVIKIFSGLSKIQAKEFLVGGTKKNGGGVIIKRPKGLTFKVRKGESEFLNAFLVNGKITVRCNWTADKKAKFGDIPNCIRHLDSLISQIKYISGIPLNSESPVKINYGKVSFNINKFGGDSLKKFVKRIKENKSNFVEDEVFGKFNYSPSDSSIIIKENSDNFSVQVSRVVRDEDIFSIIDELIVISIGTDSKINGSVVNGSVVKKKLLKDLKSAGIKIDVAGCQKGRRPRISNVLSASNSLSANALTHNGVNLICDKSGKYIYPGYTSKNVPCCFLKDQTTKKIYIKNQGKTVEYQDFSDEFNLSRQLIVTDKILDKGRIGIIPDKLSKYFSDTFVRIGTTSLLDAVNYSLNTNSISRENLLSFITPELFKTLENGKVQKKFKNIEEYIKKRFDFKDSKYVVDLISEYAKVNLLVFNSERVFCLNYKNFKYKKYVILYENIDYNYEPIIKISGTSTIQRNFIKSEIKEFLDIYNKSCIMEYISKGGNTYSVNELIEDERVLIKGQIINSDSNRISFMVTNFGIIPVIPRSKLFGVEVLLLENELLSAKKQFELLLKFGVVCSKIISNGKIVGLVLPSKLIVPVKKGKDTLESVEVSESQLISSSINSNEYLKNVSRTVSQEFKYIELFQRFRYTVSEKLKVDSKSEFTSLVKSNVFITEKVKKLSLMLINLLKDEVLIGSNSNSRSGSGSGVRQMCSKLNLDLDSCETDYYCSKEGGSRCLLFVEKKFYGNIIKNLAINILNNKEILKGEVRREFLDKSNFVNRPDEIVLLTDEDIQRYFSG